MKKDSHEATQADCAVRAKLWREYVASYQKVLAESPEAFSAFSAEFRERYVSCSRPFRGRKYLPKTLAIFFLGLVLVPLMPGQASNNPKSSREYYAGISVIPDPLTRVCFSEGPDDGSFFLIGVDPFAHDVLHFRRYSHGVSDEEWLFLKGKSVGAPWTMGAMDVTDPKSKGTIELFLNSETGRYRLRIIVHGEAPSDYGTCTNIPFKKER